MSFQSSSRPGVLWTVCSLGDNTHGPEPGCPGLCWGQTQSPASLEVRRTEAERPEAQVNKNAFTVSPSASMHQTPGAPRLSIRQGIPGAQR